MAVVVALWCVAGLLALACLAVAASRSRFASPIVYGVSLALSLLGLGCGLAGLMPGSAPVLTLPLGLPWIGAHFRIDALAGCFLVVINLGSAAASLFALGYGRHEEAPERVLPFYPAFLAGMNLVVLAADAFAFLVSWEFMSLTSCALVMARHRDSENVRAGYVYLVMASVGTIALLLAFGALAGSDGGYTFAAIRGAQPTEGLAAFIFCLALFGAGSKAGLVPLHVWLPLAHPAAPSHVSALMSGVMTKVAIYGFVRIAFDLIATPAWWWGVVVLAIGAGTAVMGILYAMLQRDLKKLLAYSTVENVGVVFAGLGLALAFKAQMPGAAALAATAALFHVLNHTLFKSLLFFGAGAVLNATGERDIEKLGGLIHRMPHTAFAVLIGCVAISALPPLNGFVSEWLTFQAILLSPALPQWGLKFTVPAAGALLALSAALAAACFVKAYGVAFLGRPRTPVAERAQETDRFSLAAMFAFAALCLLIGILPGFVIDGLAPAVQGMVNARMPVQSSSAWLSIVPVIESRSSYNGLLVFAFALTTASLAAYAIHRAASDVVRRGPPWDCGYPDPSPVTQYSADSFAQPIRRVFGTVVFRASEQVEMPPPSDPRAARLHVRVHDLIYDWLYAPIAVGVIFAADRLNYLQFLTIRRYLSLVFFALVSLLAVLALWP